MGVRFGKIIIGGNLKLNIVSVLTLGVARGYFNIKIIGGYALDCRFRESVDSNIGRSGKSRCVCKGDHTGLGICRNSSV